MRPWRDHARYLDEQDMRDMQLPSRYWETDEAMFPNKPYVAASQDDHTINRGRSAQEVIRSYLCKLRQARENGLSLWLSGANGVGKTAAAAHILKSFRAHGQTCVYVHAETYRAMAFKDVQLVNQGSLLRLCQSCDVLLLDEVGKECPDDKGYFAARFEHLLRERYANKAVTLITANFPPKRLDEIYPGKLSLKHLVMESVGQVACIGTDYRSTLEKSRFGEI